MLLNVTSLRLRTADRKPHGQAIVLSAQLDDGREVELIREWGAMPDIAIHHYVTFVGEADVPAADHRGPQEVAHD